MAATHRGVGGTVPQSPYTEHGAARLVAWKAAVCAEEYPRGNKPRWAGRVSTNYALGHLSLSTSFGPTLTT